MKPDWRDAPEWAQWLAQDWNGRWYWFQSKPRSLKGGWGSKDGMAKKAKERYEGMISSKWRETLEQRPVAGKEGK